LVKSVASWLSWFAAAGLPFAGSGLSGALQVCGDLLRDLLVFGWVRLLKLLERAHQLGKW
jgi:hypothetical protein